MQEDGGFLSRSDKPRAQFEEQKQRGGFNRGGIKAQEETGFTRGNFNAKKEEEKPKRPAPKQDEGGSGGFGFRNTNKTAKK